MPYYLGLRSGIPPILGTRDVFRCAYIPTWETHGAVYAAVVGPFQTKRGAEFMRQYGRSNPHCQCVADAERLARKYA